MKTKWVFGACVALAVGYLASDYLFSSGEDPVSAQNNQSLVSDTSAHQPDTAGNFQLEVLHAGNAPCNPKVTLCDKE